MVLHHAQSPQGSQAPEASMSPDCNKCAIVLITSADAAALEPENREGGGWRHSHNQDNMLGKCERKSENWNCSNSANMLVTTPQDAAPLVMIHDAGQ